jgi:transketolase
MEKKNSRFDTLDEVAVAALRSLAIDEINAAKSGHPGMALDAAPALYVLWKNHLISDPTDPTWINRDRFVLSAGHASSLLYAMLHLAGYGLKMEDLKKFRQLDSLTPGHPEVGHTLGVDATAGPLGQGISQAVGMAMAEEAVRASYPDGSSLISHYTYCLCGDGCLEEGLSQEAISLAGRQQLGKLILFYDMNGSTLDGPTSNSLAEDEKKRFEASHWRVFEVADGNDLGAIDEALEKAKDTDKDGRPNLIILHTIIGYGSALQGTNKVHGSPLGEEDGRHAKDVYGYHYPDFTVPAEIYDLFKKSFAARGEAAKKAWQARVKAYGEKHPEDLKRFFDAFSRNVKPYLFKTPDQLASEASRATSGRIVALLPSNIPFTLGGAADVAESVKTIIPGDPDFSSAHRNAHNVNFGIREFAMAGAQNGMLLHGGLVTYVGCFLIFSDYMKSAIRMSCLEHIPAIYLFSHDSIAVGEDGPTHEPIEQLAALRTIPGLRVLRPADARETYASWKIALESQKTPTALILSRQTLPLLPGSSEEGARKGAYIVSPNAKAKIQLLATGSEVSLAVAVQALLQSKGVEAEVVSMPSLELFEEQSDAYKKSVLRLPKDKRFVFEMAHPSLWYYYADHVYGIAKFGKSAPAKDVLAQYGFTPEAAASYVLSELR